MILLCFLFLRSHTISYGPDSIVLHFLFCFDSIFVTILYTYEHHQFFVLSNLSIPTLLPKFALSSLSFLCFSFIFLVTSSFIATIVLV